MEPSELETRLQHFVRDHGGAGASAANLRGFPESHGGLTYGFDWKEAGRPDESFVIRLAPKGVRRSGNTDVYRQAKLLCVLAEHDFPVAPVRFAGRDDTWFDTDYVIFAFMPGRAFLAWDPHPSFSREPESVAAKWRAAVALVARVHAFDWEAYLGDWETPTPIENEVERWDSILSQAAEPEWTRHGTEVRAGLLASAPPASPQGLLHGDCQPGNILFRENGEVSALLDWELSSIGSQYYDLGWLVMIGDRSSWDPRWRPVNSLEPEDLIDYYRQLTGRSCQGISWYRALANYKMAVVTGLFVKLHRSGRRIDPEWEKFGYAAPSLFRRAIELLEGS